MRIKAYFLVTIIFFWQHLQYYRKSIIITILQKIIYLIKEKLGISFIQLWKTSVSETSITLICHPLRFFLTAPQVSKKSCGLLPFTRTVHTIFHPQTCPFIFVTFKLQTAIHKHVPSLRRTHSCVHIFRTIEFPLSSYLNIAVFPWTQQHIGFAFTY